MSTFECAFLGCRYDVAFPSQRAIHPSKENPTRTHWDIQLSPASSGRITWSRIRSRIAKPFTSSIPRIPFPGCIEFHGQLNPITTWRNGHTRFSHDKSLDMTTRLSNLSHKESNRQPACSDTEEDKMKEIKPKATLPSSIRASRAHN